MNTHRRPSAAAAPPAALATGAVPGQIPGGGAQPAGHGGQGPAQEHHHHHHHHQHSSQASVGTSQSSQLSSVYRLLHTPPDSAAQLQLWRYQLPSPQLTQFTQFAQPAYSYHDSAQKAAVDRAGRFAQGPIPWRNAMSPPESGSGGGANTSASNATSSLTAAAGNAAATVVATGSGSAATAAAAAAHHVASGNGPGPGPSDNKRNTQEAVARGIAERHKHRPIAEYAAVVRQAEIAVLNMDVQTHSKTMVQTAEQNRERERQVYALLWLMKSCGAQRDSYVPRGRIFAQYAASCAQNGLKPLSQASLGKLIRAVFPDLTTRRLGMRGQSRYHYCGLKLLTTAAAAAEQGKSGDPAPAVAAVPSLQQQLVGGSSGGSGSGSGGGGSGSGGANSVSTRDLLSPLEPLPLHIDSDYEFIFVENLYQSIFSNERPIPNDFSLRFPRIPRDCLPPGSDEDTVSSLESLYHVHCNTIFEHVRFMKFDQLANCLVLFGSGSISPQMYNFFTNQSLHHWVYECDLVTHISMIKCLSRMVCDYNGVSAASISRLEDFARSYGEMVAESIIDLPVAMVTQKTKIVEYFSRLVRKLVQLLKYLRETSKILPNYKHMSKDWVSYDNLDDVLYVINRNGYEKVVPIIRQFMSVIVTQFLDELAEGRVCLDLFVREYCDAISRPRDVPAQTLMECLMMFSKVFTADISIEMQQNGYPWYVLDMLSNLLIGYIYEVNRFI